MPTTNVNPSVLTGARLLLKIDGRIVALVTDINYRVEIGVIPIEVMGAIETIAYEPNSYKVSGSFSVLRYISPISKVSSLENGTTTEAEGSMSQFLSGNQAQSGASEGNSVLDLSKTNVPSQFNPGAINLSATCQLTLYEIKNHSDASSGLIQVARFDEVRFTSQEVRPSGTHGEVKESVNFVAVLAHAGSSKTVTKSSGAIK
jgi:hypothetical protein